jgi:hypothetical protein
LQLTKRNIKHLQHVKAIDKNTALPREGITMTDQHMPRIIMEEVTDPEELAQARAQDERFARNSAWLQRHATEIYRQYRGKCIAVAGEELFIADTPEEVLAQARAAHPEEKGSILIRYIPRQKVARIYAY